MYTARKAFVHIPFIYWIVCLIAAPSIFAADLSGQWRMKCEQLHLTAHERSYVYDSGTEIEFEIEMESVGVFYFWDLTLLYGHRGWAFQSDDKIEGYIPFDICNEEREITFEGSISTDNRIALTVTIPAINYTTNQGWRFWFTELIAHLDGVYDPIDKVINGTYQYNQERCYVDHIWGSWETTNIVSNGTFAINIAVPVMLIPGWAHSRVVWVEFEKFLDKEGIPYAEVETPQYADPETNASIVAIQIEMIKERREWPSRIDLVAHSQGGLDARAYLRNLGDMAQDQVRNLTMIATPNHGTVGADWWNLYWTLRFKTEKCVPWLTPGWVEAFNQNTPIVNGVKYYTVAGSKCVLPGSWMIPGEDDGVVPVKSVHLDGANVLGPSLDKGTFPFGHSEIVAQKEVHQAIKKEIDPLYEEEPNSLAFVAIENIEHIENAESHPEKTVSRSVIVDDVNDVAFVLISDNEYLNTFLRSPDGEFITNKSTNADVSYRSLVCPDLWANSYVVRNPVPGVWKAGGAGRYDFLLLVSAENTFVLDGSTDEYFNTVGDTVGLRATLDAAATITDMWVDITDPNGSLERISLYDDGLHEDDLPHDGVYANEFSPSIEGEYTLVFSVKGVMGGREFSRVDLESIFVAASDADSF